MERSSIFKLNDTIRRLLRRNAVSHVRRILSRTHPADLAVMFRFLDENERISIYGLIEDSDLKAEVLAGLDEPILVEIISEIPEKEAVLLLNRISPDDRADILAAVPEEMSIRLLDEMEDDESDAVTGLLRYDEQTAGGIMSPDFLALTQDITAGEAVSKIQENPDVEMAFYIYITDNARHLVGVVSLRQIVMSRPEVRLKDIMTTEVVSVSTDEDQEEVARIVSRYDFLALPVVDEMKRLVGMATVDDVIDVIREEATEDILKMAGAGEDIEQHHASITGSIRSRMFWLAFTWIGGVLAFLVIAHFSGSRGTFVYLAAFIPIVMGMGGSLGTQAATIAARGISTRHIDLNRTWRLVGREVLVGMLLGIVYAAALCLFWFIYMGNLQPLSVATVACAGLAASMIMSAAIGTFIPLFLARLNLDPAIATSPFLTTITDLCSLLLYFYVASWLI